MNQESVDRTDAYQFFESLGSLKQKLSSDTIFVDVAVVWKTVVKFGETQFGGPFFFINSIVFPAMSLFFTESESSLQTKFEVKLN